MMFRSLALLSIVICINLPWGSSEAAFNPCLYGNPIDGAFCGLGPTSHPCPHYYYCASSPVDAYAMCCPDYCLSNKTPMLDQHKQPVHCGWGGVVCPHDYSCKVAPNDAWAVCCPNV